MITPVEVFTTIRDLLQEDPNLLGTYIFSNGLETPAIHNRQEGFTEKPKEVIGLEVVIIPGSNLKRTDFLSEDSQLDTIYTIQFRQRSETGSTYSATQRVIERLKDWDIKFTPLRTKSSSQESVEQIDALVTFTGIYFGNS